MRESARAGVVMPGPERRIVDLERDRAAEAAAGDGGGIGEFALHGNARSLKRAYPIRADHTKVSAGSAAGTNWFQAPHQSGSRRMLGRRSRSRRGRPKSTWRKENRHDNEHDKAAQ